MPGPGPGVTSDSGGQCDEAGIWQMALVQGKGSWGKVGKDEGSSKQLFDLLGPFHVIGSRLLASQGLDDVLQAAPEADLLQRVIKPACSGDRTKQ